jgi:hypothetical protein
MKIFKLFVAFTLICFALAPMVDAQCPNNCDSNQNTALGAGAGGYGTANTAIGYEALLFNTTGNNNTADGNTALVRNTTGENNTAVGMGALNGNSTGNNNIGLGYAAGTHILTGNNNIDIGSPGANESNTIRIGGDVGFGSQTAVFIVGINGVDKSSGNPVFIDAHGQLGTGTLEAGPQGTIIQLIQGSPAPAGGFTKIGTTQFQYHDLTGHNHVITLDVYQKN